MNNSFHRCNNRTGILKYRILNSLTGKLKLPNQKHREKYNKRRKKLLRDMWDKVILSGVSDNGVAKDEEGSLR